MSDLTDVVFFAAAAAVVVAGLVLAVCAVLALRFYVTDVRGRGVDPLSPYVPLEAMRLAASFDWPARPETELDRARARRDAERDGC